MRSRKLLYHSAIFRLVAACITAALQRERDMSWSGSGRMPRQPGWLELLEIFCLVQLLESAVVSPRVAGIQVVGPNRRA